MTDKIIERRLKPIDERLPYKQFMAKAREQADAVPLEIIEDGVVYEMFDCKLEIEGYMNTSIIFYRPMPPTQQQPNQPPTQQDGQQQQGGNGQ